jgi:hypothetical protein
MNKRGLDSLSLAVIALVIIIVLAIVVYMALTKRLELLESLS